jgi:hypothetical protein
MIRKTSPALQVQTEGGQEETSDELLPSGD